MIRPLGQFKVEQRTKDGMFNATSLLNQWNIANASKKEIKHYFENDATEEFINALISEENLHGRNSAYVKSKARADRGGGTWMHPIMFIDFAMWLNPSFKVKVLKFVYDQMLKYRNDAGDAYIKLGSAVKKIVGDSFLPAAMSNLAKAMNFCAFNEHHPLIRNEKGVEALQRELFELENKISDLINDGFLKNYDDVISYLRRKWREKYTPGILNDGTLVVNHTTSSLR